MTQIYLVRHGETEWNAAHRVQGHSDSALNALGRRQALSVVPRLRRLPIRAIFSSDLSRALDTAAPVSDALGVAVLPTAALRERSYGRWEGLTEDEIVASDPDGWRRFHVEQQLDYPVPGGESWEQVQTRVVGVLHQVLAEYPRPEDAVLLVGHAGSLRPAILDALQTPLSTLPRLRLDNASLSHLEYRAGRGGRVILLNDTSHWAETAS